MEIGRRVWNEELVNALFPAEEKRLIREVRLGGMLSQYNYVWDYTKDGN